MQFLDGCSKSKKSIWLVSIKWDVSNPRVHETLQFLRFSAFIDKFLSTMQAPPTTISKIIHPQHPQSIPHQSSPFSKLNCCSCWIEFSTTTLSSSCIFLSKISVEGKAIVGGGLGKSLWWKFNLEFKLGGDEGERECIELSETSISEASSTSKLLSTCSASGEPSLRSHSGECERLRLFFDKFNTGLSFAGEAFCELLCLSFSSWFSSSFSFRNLSEGEKKKRLCLKLSFDGHESWSLLFWPSLIFTQAWREEEGLGFRLLDIMEAKVCGFELSWINRVEKGLCEFKTKVLTQSLE